jgi:hypothetical protein
MICVNLTLGSEVEVTGELSAFMVAPKEVHSIFEPDFDSHQQGEYLYGETAPIDVIS